MKRVVIACVLMAAMLIGCGIVLFSLHQSIETLEADLTAAETLAEAKRYDEAIALLEEASVRWEKQEHLLARLLRHRELETVTQNLVSLAAYLEHGDFASFHGILAQTRLLLRHVWESELPKAENLLTIKKLP